MKKLIFLLLLFSWVPVATAASFCVTNSSELQAALDVAENNGESDVIRIAEGSYTALSGGFEFAPNITGGIDETSNIEISGGWTAFFDNPCGAGPSTDPAGTILNGGGQNRVMSVRLPQQGEVSIENLSFANGFTPDFGQGAGLRIYSASTLGFSGTLTVQSNAFIANSGGYGAGLMIGRLDSTSNIQGTSFTNIRILNNLFVSNTARTGAAGAAMVRLSTPLPEPGPVLDPRPALTLANNTILNNTRAVTSVRGVIETADAVTLNTSGANLNVINNNLRGNGTLDMEVISESDQNFVVRNNNLGSVFYAVIPDVLTDNIFVDPEYVSCGLGCIDRIPVGDSALIDAGISPGVFASAWSLPDTDAAGQIRIIGQAVDIGAYEGTPDRVFSDRFED